MDFLSVFKLAMDITTCQVQYEPSQVFCCYYFPLVFVFVSFILYCNQLLNLVYHYCYLFTCYMLLLSSVSLYWVSFLPLVPVFTVRSHRFSSLLFVLVPCSRYFAPWFSVQLEGEGFASHISQPLKPWCPPTASVKSQSFWNRLNHLLGGSTAGNSLIFLSLSVPPLYSTCYVLSESAQDDWQAILDITGTDDSLFLPLPHYPPRTHCPAPDPSPAAGVSLTLSSQPHWGLLSKNISLVIVMFPWWEMVPKFKVVVYDHFQISNLKQGLVICCDGKGFYCRNFIS